MHISKKLVGASTPVDIVDIVEAWVKEHPRYHNLFTEKLVNGDNKKLIVVYMTQPAHEDSARHNWILSFDETSDCWTPTSLAYDRKLVPGDPKFFDELTSTMEARLHEIEVLLAAS